MPLLPPTFHVRLVERTALSPTVCRLLFERVDGVPFEFEAGQWVNLVLPAAEAGASDGAEAGAAPTIRRAYSVASPPLHDARFELAVTRVETGPGSTLLHTMEIGRELEVVGPQGFFTRPLEKAGPSLFVGTGTGLTPLRSMLLHAARAESSVPVWLLFGVREESDILFREELEAVARSNAHRMRVEFTLSRAAEGWTGRRGWVQTHVRELWEGLRDASGQDPHVYICGLRDMVDGVRDLLKTELALPRQLVHSERYD
jgi:ferredoxin-NADP reductase